MDDLALPLLLFSPIYVPALLFAAGMALTRKERKHPAVLTNSEVFFQMKTNTFGFKLATIISASIPTAFAFIDMVILPSHNDGGRMAQIIIFLLSLFPTAVGLTSLYFYNVLFLAGTKLKAALILAYPFSGLATCILCIFFMFSFTDFTMFLIAIPYIIIFIIMMLVYNHKKTLFPDPFTLKISILKQK